MANPIEPSLGLARKAGKCAAGTQSCLKAIRRGWACMVFIEAGAGQTTVDTITGAARAYGVPCRMLDGDVRLERALGKPNVRVAALTDPGFLDLIGDIGNNHTDAHGGAEKE